MSGHYGCEKVTTQNLLVLAVNKDNNTIMIKGNVPGPINQILKIKNSVKNKKPIVAPTLIIKTISFRTIKIWIRAFCRGTNERFFS